MDDWPWAVVYGLAIVAAAHLIKSCDDNETQRQLACMKACGEYVRDVHGHMICRRSR